MDDRGDALRAFLGTVAQLTNTLDNMNIALQKNYESQMYIAAVLNEINEKIGNAEIGANKAPKANLGDLIEIGREFFADKRRKK